MFAGLLVNAEPAHAGAVFAKITRVLQQTSGDGFGPFVYIQIDFDRTLGANCSVTGSAQYRMYLIGDEPTRELAKQSLEGFRQLATSAFLSGRTVHVDSNGCISSWHQLTGIHII